MSHQQDRTGVRRAGVYSLSVLLGLGGVGLLLLVAGRFPHDQPFRIAWWLLVPAYVLALQRPLTFDLRGESRDAALTQLPLCFGVVFVAPWLHLAARVVVGVIDSLLLRRQSPVKALFNICSGVAEVGICSLVLLAAEGDLSPRPQLWVLLVLGCVAADTGVAWALGLVFALMGSPMSVQQRRHMLSSTATTSLVFGVVATLAIAAAWSDRSTIVLAGGLVVGLGLAYRRHRHLGQQAQQQAELQQFMRATGPLDLTSADSPQVLETLRSLLRAKHLQLSLLTVDGWVHHTAGEVRDIPASSLADLAARTAANIEGREDRMSAPLLGQRDLVGVLTVREHVSTTQRYDLRDLQTLESAANELAKAIERGRLQRALHLAATTDPVTGLPNLPELTRELTELLASGRSVLLAAVAVDSFREVNDTLGHEVGDELLAEVTRRLRLCRPVALIGRVGGGRFAVAVNSGDVGDDVAMFGLELRTQVEGGAQLGPVGTHIKLSVGCVVAPDHGTDASTLIRRAETAMYSARGAHGGPVLWAPAYEVNGQRRLAVVSALREALSSGAIGVVFQPKVGALTDEVTGVEALARWTHPALGAVSPAEFIPLAEAAGLMGPLTTTVLRQAVIACQGWQRRGGHVGVAVNVSAETLLDPSFVTEVAAVLRSVNMDPALLTIELTEGVVLDDPQLAADRMQELSALGLRLSVDDFGTGYSSLTYLKGLPVDEVKIDKGFVDDLVNDLGDRAVVRAVVDIAHTLGLRVVAEGVENADQHQLLASLGVDEIQGYLHARPMPALDMASWLRRRGAASDPDATGEALRPRVPRWSGSSSP